MRTLQTWYGDTARQASPVRDEAGNSPCDRLVQWISETNSDYWTPASQIRIQAVFSKGLAKQKADYSARPCDYNFGCDSGFFIYKFLFLPKNY